MLAPPPMRKLKPTPFCGERRQKARDDIAVDRRDGSRQWWKRIGGKPAPKKFHEMSFLTK
jgi:hypothetical protein